MRAEAERRGQGALAERKQALLREAEIRRIGIVHAREQLRDAMRPSALMHELLEQAGRALQQRLGALNMPSGLALQAVLPVAASVLTVLARRRLLKPAAALVAVAVAGALFVLRRRPAP